jgi:biotin carboxylase
MNVLLVAPQLSPNTLSCLDALCGLDIRLGIVTPLSKEQLPERYRRRLDGHYRVGDCGNEAQLTAACQHFQKEWGRVERLIGFLETLQVPLGVARDRCGIPGMGAEVAQNFREKNQMKQVLRQAGLPVARQALLHNLEEGRRFIGQVGYPIVVKPPAGMGSRATMRVRDANELVEALKVLEVSPKNPAQAEEFVTGEEHTFETVSIAGKPVWHSSSYYLPGPLQVLENPWMQYSILLPKERLQPHAEAFRPTNIRALAALGMETGISHMEWFLRADGSPVISEVGARPPGVKQMPMMGLAHGVDFWQAWVELMVLGRWNLPERRFAAGCVFFRGQGKGERVTAIHGLEEAQERAGKYVVDKLLPQVGQRKNSGYEGEGWALVRAESTAEVVAALKGLLTTVRVELG